MNQHTASFIHCWALSLLQSSSLHAKLPSWKLRSESGLLCLPSTSALRYKKLHILQCRELQSLGLPRVSLLIPMLYPSQEGCLLRRARGKSHPLEGSHAAGSLPDVSLLGKVDSSHKVEGTDYQGCNDKASQDKNHYLQQKAKLISFAFVWSRQCPASNDLQGLESLRFCVAHACKMTSLTLIS